jgi:hypothetical protein
MPIEAVLMAVILLLVLAVLVCIGVIYRMGRAGTTVSPILDRRLLSIEGSISRSDSTIREEFGRGRDETREASRSLREEVTGQFRSLSESVRGSIGDLTTGQNTRLADFAERLDGAKNAAAADAKALGTEASRSSFSAQTAHPLKVAVSIRWLMTNVLTHDNVSERSKMLEHFKWISKSLVILKKRTSFLEEILDKGRIAIIFAMRGSRGYSRGRYVWRQIRGIAAAS